jgi:hypothetical protein
MGESTVGSLTAIERRDLRRLAGFMVPADAAYGVPGADDSLIFDDILRSMGLDLGPVRTALARLRDLSGGDFTVLDDAAAEAVAMEMLAANDGVTFALGRAVLQCYYRDDRVFASIGREARAPFPKGHELEQGDFSLAEVVRARRRIWRDLDGFGDGTGD